ncbi:hypothetical protein DET47_10399 [Shewanella putrefaciens]|nr:hypothetical protein DET47_10399 [Shewanella putrefaciens]
MKPFYLDWQFWAAFVAFLALVLSQLPPVITFFKKRKLTLEKYRLVTVSHHVGTPSLSTFLILKNEGGSSLNIKSIELIVTKDKREEFKLMGNGYLKNPNDPQYTMLTPFELHREQSWAHTIIFNELWSRKQQQRYRQLESNIRNHIFDQNKENSLSQGKLHEAKEDDVKEINAFFKENFKWDAGEYSVQINVFGEQRNILVSDTFDFVLFENESKELESYHEEYKYGAGVYYNSVKQVGIVLDISQ